MDMTTVWWLLGAGSIRGLNGNGKNYNKIKPKEKRKRALAGLAQWIEHRLRTKGLPHGYFSHLFLPPFLSLKINK